MAYKEALRASLNPIHLYRTLKYKYEFKRDNPFFFDPCGTLIFCGAQGEGKTLSAVNYVCNLLEQFPCAVLVSNVSITDYPYNSAVRLNSDGSSCIYDLESGDVITSDDIIHGRVKRVCIEYDGLDTLKYVNNGQFGVVYLIDEIHLELNSLESKNIDIDVMTEISQQRKQRKHIVGTSQVYMRMAKPLREQVRDIVICSNFFGMVQFNKLIDGEKSTENNGKLEAYVRKRFLWFHDPVMYDRYDTYAKMKRYNKEWQGKKRDVIIREVG